MRTSIQGYTHSLANDSRPPFLGDQTIPNTEEKRPERVDRAVVDLCPASCIIFVMSKSSPQKTIGAPAPGAELTAVQMHRTVTASQALGATQKDNTGT